MYNADFLQNVGTMLPRSNGASSAGNTRVHLMGIVKLYGSHADIVFASATSDEIRLQSRNRLRLTAGRRDDNQGFATFVSNLKPEVLLALRHRILTRYGQLHPGKNVEGEIVLAGEWCGRGIQKNVGVSQVDKFFAIISININVEWVPDWEFDTIDDQAEQIFHAVGLDSSA